MSSNSNRPSLRIITDPVLSATSTNIPAPRAHNGRLRAGDVFPSTATPKAIPIDIFKPPSPLSDTAYDSDSTVLGSPSSPSESTKVPGSPDSLYTLSGYGEIALSNSCFIATSNPDHDPSSNSAWLIRVKKPPMPKRRHQRDTKSPRLLWRTHICGPPHLSPSTPTSPLLSPQSEFKSLVDGLRSKRISSSIQLNLAPVDAPDRKVQVSVSTPTKDVVFRGINDMKCLPTTPKPPKRPLVPNWDAQ